MENNEDINNEINGTKNKKEKKIKKRASSKKVKSKNSKKIKLSNKNNPTESEKNIEKPTTNENIKIVYQKETEDIKIKNKINYDFENNELKKKIEKKIEEIKELSLTQEIEKKSLIELLKKVSQTIESNADILYSKNDIEKKEEVDELKILKLKEILEKKQKEYLIVKGENKKYKNKYEFIINDLNSSSIEKFENFHRRLNALKENNNLLNKEINILTHKNNIEKKLGFNQKSKIADIKKYSDEYVLLMKEKSKQNTLLNNNKKLIKDTLIQFQNLLNIIHENNIKVEEFDNEIKNLKEDLSGDEEIIFNKVINDKTIIMNNYNKHKSNKNNNKNNSLKNIKLCPVSRTKNIHSINKILPHSKSCNDIINQNNNVMNSYDSNLSDYDLNNIKFDSLSNNDFKKISEKKQKYLNLAEKLDKTINDISINYEHRIKKISNVVDMNSKKLSNIQQENELLQSKIADMKKIIELKKKENQKKINENSRYNFNKKYEYAIKKLNLVSNENKDEKNDKEEKATDRENFIKMIKQKYKLKNRDENIINNKSIN